MCYCKTPLCVLFAVYLAYRFANTQARTKRGVELIKKQLLDFYSPMFGCIKRIHAQGACVSSCLKRQMQRGERSVIAIQNRLSITRKSSSLTKN